MGTQEVCGRPDTKADVALLWLLQIVRMVYVVCGLTCVLTLAMHSPSMPVCAASAWTAPRTGDTGHGGSGGGRVRISDTPAQRATRPWGHGRRQGCGACVGKIAPPHGTSVNVPLGSDLNEIVCTRAVDGTDL